MIKLFKQSLNLNNLKTFVVLFILLVILVSLLILQATNFKLDTKKLSFSSKSKADISLDKNKLNINFSIDPKDQSKVEDFSKQLNVSTNWSKGISIDIDQASADRIRPILPVQVSLDFKPGGLEFSNSILSNLQSSLPNQKYEYATMSAKALLQKNSDKDFYLELIEPDTLLRQATISGSVNLSSKIMSVFPILERIAKIEVRDKNGSIAGKILLKN